MKLVTSLFSIALLFLAILSSTTATPLPIPEATATASTPENSLLTRDIPQDCINSGGFWNYHAGWCVCAGDYPSPPGTNTCKKGQGYYDQWVGPLEPVGEATKRSAGFLGLTVAGAAAMVLL